MAERQIGYRKSRRSRSVAKSAYVRVRALSISPTRLSRSLERARPLIKAVFML